MMWRYVGYLKLVLSYQPYWNTNGNINANAAVNSIVPNEIMFQQGVQSNATNSHGPVYYLYNPTEMKILSPIQPFSTFAVDNTNCHYDIQNSFYTYNGYSDTNHYQANILPSYFLKGNSLENGVQANLLNNNAAIFLQMPIYYLIVPNYSEAQFTNPKNREIDKKSYEDSDNDLFGENELIDVEVNTEIKANDNFSFHIDETNESVSELIISIIDKENLSKDEKFVILSKVIRKNKKIKIEDENTFVKIINFLPFDIENSNYKFILLFRKVLNFKSLNLKDSIDFLCHIFDESVSHENRMILIHYFFEKRFIEFSELKRFINHIVNIEEKSLFDKTIDFIDVSSFFEYIEIDKMDSETLISLLTYEKSMNKKGFSLDFNRYLIQFIQKLENKAEVENVLEYLFLNFSPEFINAHLIYFDQESISKTILKISDSENAETILNGIDVSGYLAANAFVKDLLLAFQNKNIEEVKNLSLEFRYYDLLSLSSANQLIFLYNSNHIIEYAAFLADKTSWPSSSKLILRYNYIRRVIDARFTLNFECKSRINPYIDLNSDFFNFYLIKILESEYYVFLLDEKFIFRKMQTKEFKRFNYLSNILVNLLKIAIPKNKASETFICNFIYSVPMKFRPNLAEYLISKASTYLESNNPNDQNLKEDLDGLKRILTNTQHFYLRSFTNFDFEESLSEVDESIKKEISVLTKKYKTAMEKLANIFMKEWEKYTLNTVNKFN